jgi:hypothetical protein
MKNYELIIGSPVDYDELVIYIQIDNKHVALVSKDKGVDKMEVEFFSEIATSKICLDDVISALQEAKEELAK